VAIPACAEQRGIQPFLAVDARVALEQQPRDTGVPEAERYEWCNSGV
jgi:hypothetical protein